MKSGQEISPLGSQKPTLITVGSVLGTSDVLGGCVSVGTAVLVIGVWVVIGWVVETVGVGEAVVFGIAVVVFAVWAVVFAGCSLHEIRSAKMKQNIRNTVIFFIQAPPLVVLEAGF